MTLGEACKLARIVAYREPERPRLWARAFVALPEWLRRLLTAPLILVRPC